MKYVVIGAGGTGGCLGGFLAEHGHDVTLIARNRHLEEIRRNGLILKSCSLGERQIRSVKACTMEEYSDTPDVVFVCVKFYSLEETISFLQRIASENTLVIPILNIFGTGGILERSCPAPVILDGCIYIYSMIEAPGIVVQPRPIFRVFFGYRKGQPHRLEALASRVEQDLKETGIDAHFTDEIQKEALTKFSYVSPIGAAGIYLNQTGGAFKRPGEAQELFLTLVHEIETLGHAMGIVFDEDLGERNLKILEDLDDDSTTSMQRDVQNGGPSEMDGLVHRIVRLADEYGLELPAYRKISRWAVEQGLL
ncbi:MAG: ketopantoate reductase family protein [Lacrimispora saccharolytica]